MAFPYYSTYQPYGYPQNFQQPMPQQIPQQNPATTGMIWVSGLQEAQKYPLAPNNAVVLWEQSGKTIYLKSADATGKPTLHIYDLVERSETASKNVIYAKKDDLETVLGMIKGISNDIEQMKSDLYGFAGRKKTVSKKPKDEEEEEE